jgi:hypothetical protein
MTQVKPRRGPIPLYPTIQTNGNKCSNLLGFFADLSLPSSLVVFLQVLLDHASSRCTRSTPAATICPRPTPGESPPPHSVTVQPGPWSCRTEPWSCMFQSYRSWLSPMGPTLQPSSHPMHSSVFVSTNIVRQDSANKTKQDNQSNAMCDAIHTR